MVEHGILVDVSHMSDASLRDTFALLDELDPGGRVPVLATHVACRLRRLDYNLRNETIETVAARGGVVGLLACTHFVRDGFRKPRSFADSADLLCRHVDRIVERTGSFDHVAIGSDLDGYIKPALPRVQHLGHMSALQAAFVERYGEENAGKLSSGNVLRVLGAAWRQPLSPA